MTLSHPKYRPDVDGLRAIAVLSVVGFHAFPEWIRGGFIGVDIFFVISGFLISSIIFNSLHQSSFSFTEFYSRRITRIFPALILVLVFSFILGWHVLLADEFKQLGKQIAGGAAFISNFILWRESGYFDNTAETKPLLHLWSLGIEEQFYFVWPLLLWAAFKFRFNLMAMALSIAGISFLLNVLNITKDPVATFYAPQTRFWELMIGALLSQFVPAFQNWSFNLKSQKLRDLFANGPSITGLVLILIGFFYLQPSSLFPGWWALLPTLGAALILMSNKSSWVNRVALSHPLMVWFGVISYPLYLWHWPLLAYARILEGGLPSAVVRVGLILFAVFLAWLTYRFIERPIRFGIQSRIKVIVLAMLMVGVGYTGFHVYTHEGLNQRPVVALNALKFSGNDGGDQGFSINECGIKEEEGKSLFASCLSDKRQTAKFALIGDSKAGSLYGGLVRTSHNDGRWLFIGGTGSNGLSVLVESPHEIYKVYQKLTPKAYEAVIRNPNIDTVVLAMATRHLFGLHDHLLLADLPDSNHDDVALKALDFSIARLVDGKKKVVIVVDNPSLPDPKDCVSREASSRFLNFIFQPKSNVACHLTISDHLARTEKYQKLLDTMVTKYPHQVRIFDTLSYMCDEKEGSCKTYKNGRLMYSFGDHISDHASGLIGKDLNDFLMKR